MIPTYFFDIADTPFAKDVAKKYFEDQYPQTEDCTLLPKQLVGLKKDLEDINKRISAKQKEYDGKIPTIKVPCKPTSSYFSGSCKPVRTTGFHIGGATYVKTEINPNFNTGISIRSKSKLIVEELIRRKTLLIELSCSNVVSPDELVNPQSTITAETEQQNQSSTAVENTTSTTTNPLVKTSFVDKLNKMEGWKKGLLVLVIVGSTYLGYKLIKK